MLPLDEPLSVGTPCDLNNLPLFLAEPKVGRLLLGVPKLLDQCFVSPRRLIDSTFLSSVTAVVALLSAEELFSTTVGPPPSDLGNIIPLLLARLVATTGRPLIGVVPNLDQCFFSAAPPPLLRTLLGREERTEVFVDDDDVDDSISPLTSPSLRIGGRNTFSSLPSIVAMMLALRVVLFFDEPSLFESSVHSPDSSFGIALFAPSPRRLPGATTADDVASSSSPRIGVSWIIALPSSSLPSISIVLPPIMDMEDCCFSSFFLKNRSLLADCNLFLEVASNENLDDDDAEARVEEASFFIIEEVDMLLLEDGIMSCFCCCS
mmetsp:Transcript_4730/g.9127  ORF Transcript_4730/g.9127 Transcript_4730/m.9127 type:complete len:320 (-) Transcript_4730:837-1796(-)